MDAKNARALRTAPLNTSTDLKPNAVKDISGALNILLADVFALYLKTKGSGPRRDPGYGEVSSFMTRK
jgi:starvation-inducible DNA-binding protein